MMMFGRMNRNKQICITLNNIINCNNNKKKLLSTVTKSTATATATAVASSIDKHVGTAVSQPLIEHYRPRWPEPQYKIDETNELSVSPSSKVLSRTIPDSKLRFKLKSTFDHGASIFYPHLKFHAADYKVTLLVYIDDLGLSNEEKQIFIEMVGKRYNVGKKEVKLIAERFPNRIENKRYLILLLESLILESKKLNKLPSKYLK